MSKYEYGITEDELKAIELISAYFANDLAAKKVGDEYVISLSSGTRMWGLHYERLRKLAVLFSAGWGGSGRELSEVNLEVPADPYEHRISELEALKADNEGLMEECRDLEGKLEWQTNQQVQSTMVAEAYSAENDDLTKENVRLFDVEDKLSEEISKLKTRIRTVEFDNKQLEDERDGLLAKLECKMEDCPPEGWCELAENRPRNYEALRARARQLARGNPRASDFCYTRGRRKP